MKTELQKRQVLFQLSFGVSPEHERLRERTIAERNGHVVTEEAAHTDLDHLKRLSQDVLLTRINESRRAFSFQRTLLERWGIVEDSYALVTPKEFDAAVSALVAEGRIRA